MQEWLFGNWGGQIIGFAKQDPWQAIFVLSVASLLITLLFGKWSSSGDGGDGDFSGIFGGGDGDSSGD